MSADIAILIVVGVALAMRALEMSRRAIAGRRMERSLHAMGVPSLYEDLRPVATPRVRQRPVVVSAGGAGAVDGVSEHIPRAS